MSWPSGRVATVSCALLEPEPLLEPASCQSVHSAAASAGYSPRHLTFGRTRTRRTKVTCPRSESAAVMDPRSRIGRHFVFRLGRETCSVRAPRVRHFIKAIVQHKGSASHCPAGRGKSHGQPTLILRETNVVAGTPPPAEHPGSLLIGRPCAACRIVHYHTLAVPSDS
jgi:hypothetical protein